MFHASRPKLPYFAASLAIFLCLPATATTSRVTGSLYCEADGKISASEVPYFVGIFFDPGLTFEELCYAEVMLATGPMKEVCTALLPLIELRFSEQRPRVHISGSPDAFAEHPYPRPSVDAAWRVFSEFLYRNSGPLSAQLARKLLQDAEFRSFRPFLVQFMEGQWNKESERIACDLFEDISSGYHLRRAAATVLFHQKRVAVVAWPPHVFRMGWHPPALGSLPLNSYRHLSPPRRTR